MTAGMLIASVLTQFQHRKSFELISSIYWIILTRRRSIIWITMCSTDALGIRRRITINVSRKFSSSISARHSLILKGALKHMLNIVFNKGKLVRSHPRSMIGILFCLGHVLQGGKLLCLFHCSRKLNRKVMERGWERYKFLCSCHAKHHRLFPCHRHTKFSANRFVIKIYFYTLSNYFESHLWKTLS